MKMFPFGLHNLKKFLNMNSVHTSAIAGQIAEAVNKSALYPKIDQLNVSPANNETYPEMENENKVNNVQTSPTEVINLEDFGRCVYCIRKYKPCQTCKLQSRLKRSLSKRMEEGNVNVQKQWKESKKTAFRSAFLFWVRGIMITLAVGTSMATLYGGATLVSQGYRGITNGTHVNRDAVPVEAFNTIVTNLGKLLKLTDNRDEIIRNKRSIDNEWSDSFYNICVYWMSDCDGMDVPKVVASRGADFNLHGAWNVSLGEHYGKHPKCKYPTDEEIRQNNCMTKGEFESTFVPLRGFFDASPATNYTCCNSQYHEYYCHACKLGRSYDEWYTAVQDCITRFNTSQLYPHQCRYDGFEGVNYVETASSPYLSFVGCVPGAPVKFRFQRGCDTNIAYTMVAGYGFSFDALKQGMAINLMRQLVKDLTQVIYKLVLAAY